MRHLLFGCSIILALNGCVRSNNPVSPGVAYSTSASSIQDSIKYTLYVSKPIFNRSDTLEAFFVATNIGKDTNRTFPVSCMGLPWTLKNPSGVTVMQKPQSLIECQSFFQAILTPGQTCLLDKIDQVIPNDPSVIGLDSLKMLNLSLSILVN